MIYKPINFDKKNCIRIRFNVQSTNETKNVP